MDRWSGPLKVQHCAWSLAIPLIPFQLVQINCHFVSHIEKVLRLWRYTYTPMSWGHSGVYACPKPSSEKNQPYRGWSSYLVSYYPGMS